MRFIKLRTVFATMLTACFAFSFAQVQAQTISVNGQPCNGATVTLGAGTIAINTSNCNVTVSPPVINASTPPGGNIGASYTHTFSASGSPTSWAITGAVPGLTFNSGVLSGTPTTAGAYSLSITATNSGGTSAALPVTVNITAPSGPPALQNIAPATAATNVLYSHQYIATGAQPITFSASVVPLTGSGITITSAGLLSGTPTVAGTYTITVTASNTVLPDATATVNLVVTTPIVPVVGALTIPLTGTVGTTYPSQTFVTSAGTSPITWGIASGGTLPPGMAINPTTGVLGGTPNTAGTYTFAVQATNSAGSGASASYVVVISGSSLPPGTIFSVDNIPIPEPSKQPGKSGDPHTNAGAGVLMNAWAVDPVRCNAPNGGPPATTPAISRAWHHNIDFDPYSAGFSNDFFDMGANEVLSYKFTPTQTGLGTITLTETTWGPLPANFISLSTKPCDFDYAKLANGAVRDFCYKSATRENSIYFQVTAGTASNITYCKLTPGTTYYFNVRWQDGRIPASLSGPATDSCANNGAPRCAGLIQIGR